MKLKDLLKNEWVKTGIMLVIVLIAFFGFWFGIRFALATEYPLLAVASGSMVTTLNIGDLIVVHGVPNASEIYAAPYPDGDIIVFHTYLPDVGGEPGPNLDPLRGPDELIVHRAINRTLKWDNRVEKYIWYFVTLGDGNHGAIDPWVREYGGVPEYYVVGKVVGVVPWIGNIPLFIRTPTGLVTVVALILIVLIVEFVFSAVREKRKPPSEAAQEQQV